MKTLLGLILAAALVAPSYAEETKTKKVCKDVVVKGKTTQQCKTIKIHKKHKGTAVPVKK